MRTSHRPKIVAFAAAMSVAALVFAPTAAYADTDIPVDFIFEEPTVSVEYGQGWGFYGAASTSIGLFMVDGTDPTAASISGRPDYKPTLYTNNQGGVFTAGIYPSESQPALDAGTYTIGLTTFGLFNEPNVGVLYFRASAKPNGTLTITKAPLVVDFRILADTNNRDGAVVSARLTGTFANGYPYQAGYPASPAAPSGSWAFIIKDSDGEVALEKNFDAAAGDSPLATSFYWSDAEAGVSYSGSMVFTPDSATNTNFEITQAPEFEFTAPELQRPVPESTLAPPTADAPRPSTDFAVPLWVLLSGAILALGLATAVVLLSLRFARSRPNLQEPVAGLTTKENVE